MLPLLDSMLKIYNIEFESPNMELKMTFREEIGRITGKPQSAIAFAEFAAAGDR